METWNLNIRALLDAKISIALLEMDLSDYKTRSQFIDKIEERFKESTHVSLSDGTTFAKEFEPRKTKQES